MRVLDRPGGLAIQAIHAPRPARAAAHAFLADVGRWAAPSLRARSAVRTPAKHAARLPWFRRDKPHPVGATRRRYVRALDATGDGVSTAERFRRPDRVAPFVEPAVAAETVDAALWVRNLRRTREQVVVEAHVHAPVVGTAAVPLPGRPRAAVLLPRTAAHPLVRAAAFLDLRIAAGSHGARPTSRSRPDAGHRYGGHGHSEHPQRAPPRHRLRERARQLVEHAAGSHTATSARRGILVTAQRS